MTPESRNARLTSDYREMCNIRGPIISWQVTRGAPPYAEAYRMTVRVRSIIGPQPTYRDQHVIDIDIPAGYPYSPPQAFMITDPVVFHPNWWEDTRWCGGTWDFGESLGYFVVRMIRTLQYDPIITNEKSAANRDAAEWYLSHLNAGIFPCDRQHLPDPSKSRFEIQPSLRKRFEILQ